MTIFICNKVIGHGCCAPININQPNQLVLDYSKYSPQIPHPPTGFVRGFTIFPLTPEWGRNIVWVSVKFAPTFAPRTLISQQGN